MISEPKRVNRRGVGHKECVADWANSEPHAPGTVDSPRVSWSGLSAAASLREGLTETLTLQRLGVTGALYRTLRSTNAIENLNGLVGHFIRDVRRWRDGAMLVRWIATGLQDPQ